MAPRGSDQALTQGVDQLRLLAKVARLYHEQGVSQPRIAGDLHISQSRVSRLLRQAADLGIVRTMVTLPHGVYTDVEQALESRYGLDDSVVVDADGALGDVTPALGAAAAVYISATLSEREVVGISSWSATLLAAVEGMRPKKGVTASVVTQLVGGVGDPGVQMSANRLLDRFSTLTGSRPLFLPTPGLVRDPAVRRALLQDPAVAPVLKAWDQLTIALIGIGDVRPSPLARRSGNTVDPDQQDELRRLGAVGDVCFRFFDPDGRLVDSPFNDRVVGITPTQIKKVPRRIGVAGGPGKGEAIRAAVRGGWVNTLITDLDSARWLLSDH
jgi:DNA-binding transcriptional regulator LsrR (DeoR family)